MEPLTPEQIAELTGQAAPAQEVAAPEEAVAITEPQPEAPKPSEALKAAPGEPTDFTYTDDDGKPVTVVIAKPPKATSLHVAKVLGMQSANPGLDLYYKSMMWVREVNGKKIPFLATASLFEGLSELLGDEGLERLVLEVMQRQSASQTFDWDAVKKS